MNTSVKSMFCVLVVSDLMALTTNTKHSVNVNIMASSDSANSLIPKKRHNSKNYGGAPAHIWV